MALPRMGVWKDVALPSPKYRRGQAEWALWRMFDYGAFAARPMPGVFRTRIKRLLDIDRAGPMPGADHTAAAFAFSEDAPSGSGAEAAFTAFDVFCLALGLDLLEMGFKQAEIVFLLRHARDPLQDAFAHIATHYPPADRQRRRAQDFPHCPAVKLNSGALIADASVYMLTHKLDRHDLTPLRGRPQIAPPQICFGREALHAALTELEGKQRKTLVLEIGVHARLAPRLLAQAPEVKRGRPS